MDAVFWMVGDWAWRGDRMRETVRAAPATRAGHVRAAAPAVAAAPDARDGCDGCDERPSTLDRERHVALALDEVSARAR